MEKDKKTTLISLLIAIFIFLIIVIGILYYGGFLRSENSKLIGTWREYNTDEIWVFYENGYFEIINLSENGTLVTPGYWKFNDGKLKITRYVYSSVLNVWDLSYNYNYDFSGKNDANILDLNHDSGGSFHLLKRSNK